MNFADEPIVAVAAAEDRLAGLHLRIAQRADELAHEATEPPSRDTDLKCWLAAEAEILGEDDW